MTAQYGNNMVLVRTKNGQTRDEIISAYNEFVTGTRQKTREQIDREFLNGIEDNQFQVVIRQYTGHRYIPSCANVDGHLKTIVWISTVIRWC